MSRGQRARAGKPMGKKGTAWMDGHVGHTGWWAGFERNRNLLLLLLLLLLL